MDTKMGKRRSYRTEKRYIDTPEGKLKLLVLTPPGNGTARVGVLWIHGGGYSTGMAAMAHFTRARDLCAGCGTVVVSPEYRLSGKAPYPAALHDCHAALLYLRDHAAALGVRDDQIMVGGESAGGGLAVALCMYEHDLGVDGVRIAFQMPLYPMLDCEDTETSRDNHAPVWNTRRNHYGWRQYLRDVDKTAVPCYASPARRVDYTGLPPAYTFVTTVEPFYAETMTYIRRLQEAGIRAHVDVYPGLFHAFDMLLPWLPVSRKAAHAFTERFRYAAAHDFAPQWIDVGGRKSK